MRLDEKPALFFTLRGVKMQELLTAASARATAPLIGATAPGKGLGDDALSEIFGVEIEGAAPASLAPADQAKPARKAPPAKRKTPVAETWNKRKAAAPKAKKKK